MPDPPVPLPSSEAYQPLPARVTRERVGRRTVLAVTGEVDLSSVGVIGAAVESAVADGAGDVWIDLSDVAFMDSTTLHLLLATRRRLGALNRGLAIICPDGWGRDLLELTGVAGCVSVYRDQAAADRAG